MTATHTNGQAGVAWDAVQRGTPRTGWYGVEPPIITGLDGVVTDELAGAYQHGHTYAFGRSSTESKVYTVTVYDAAGHSTPVGFPVARDAQPPTATVQAPRAVVSPPSR